MELVEDRTTKVPATKLTEKLIRQCYLNGMLLLSCGQSTIRFMPPLMVAKEHVDEAVAILDASLGETLSA
jgi:4-aminobutyrate aminotransferase